MAQFSNQATLLYNGIRSASNIAAGEIVESLAVTKTAVSGVYGEAGSVVFVISMVNSGSTALSGLTLTDDLGEYKFGTLFLTPLSYTSGSAKYYVNGALQPAPTVAAGPPLTFTPISVPAGGSAVIIYEASANQYAPMEAGSSITNGVSVSGEGLAAPVTAEETISAAEEPELSLTKTVFPASVTGSDTVTYTFLIQNTGNTAADAASGVVITDTFSPVLDITGVTFNGASWTQGTQYTYDEATGLFTTADAAVTVPAASYTQDTDTGEWTATPGVSTLTVSGTLS
ncbi:MAG: hypothetical protein ILP09_08390 [Oscillospiraceae bacterium]|nr:hypothetical protein [Oscillospiraceae bacterium]